jgi:hypothetical protein
MDLSSWNEDHYLPKWTTKMKLRFGAKRLRCEYCRFNFAGWRPLKMKYQWRRRKSNGAIPETDNSRHLMSDPQDDAPEVTVSETVSHGGQNQDATKPTTE